MAPDFRDRQSGRRRRHRRSWCGDNRRAREPCPSASDRFIVGIHCRSVLGTTGGGGGGSGTGGGGYSAWGDIGSATGAISSIAVTIALDANQDIDDYEEMYVHIEANDTNDQRSVTARFRASEVPVGADLLVGFPGNNTDEGSLLIRRNADGTELTLDHMAPSSISRLPPSRQSGRGRLLRTTTLTLPALCWSMP